MNNTGKIIKIFFFIIAIFILVIQIYPVFWIIMSSFKDATELMESPSYALPKGFYAGNYITAIFQSKLLNYYQNSIIVAIGTIVGLIVIGSPAAYAISKIPFKQNEFLLSFFLFGIMIPGFACLIPMFQIYNTVGLRNTYWSIIFPQIAFGLPMCIYLYTGYMRFIPNSLIEAAIIDGANNFIIFLRIMFPMAKNSTITVIIFNFVSVWNEFTWANTFMTSSTMKTLPIGLNDFVGFMGRRNWGATFAAIVLAVVPTIIVYFILNKHIMAGMAAGSVKE
jgi:raffinose/stachyose/melibiose transport system permease protein